MRRTQREHGSALRVVGLNLDLTGRRELLAWLSRNGVRWPRWYDGRGVNGDLARRLGIPYVPRMFVFDRTGQLVAVDIGVGALRNLALGVR